MCDFCCISVYQCVSCCSSCGHAHTHIYIHTHTNTKKRTNESCWELELCSIRVTTYLQTVGGKLPLCDSSAKRHTCTFDSGPASPNCTAPNEGREEQRDRGREGGRWQGVDRMKNTHMPAGCTCASNHINKYMCAYKHLCKLNELILTPVVRTTAHRTCLLLEHDAKDKFRLGRVPEGKEILPSSKLDLHHFSVF